MQGKRWPGAAEQWIECCISKCKRTFIDGAWAEVGGDGGKPTWSPLIFGDDWASLGFPGGSSVKNPPAVQEMQEMWTRSLGQEDPLEDGMATHSSILAGKIPWTEKPAGYRPWSRKD